MSDSVDLNDTEQEALDAAEQELEAQDDAAELTNAETEDVSSPVASSEEGIGSTEAAETNDGWQRALEQAGFQSFDDVDNAVKALVDANRQRDDQIRHYADQVRFYQDQLKTRDTTSSQPAQPQEPSKPTDPLAGLIEDWKDPAWANQYIEVDDEGNRVIADNVDDDTREKILGIDRKLRQWQEVLQDPRQFAAAVDQRVERMIQEKFEHSYQEKQTQAQEKAAVDSFVNQNANWLYQRDPATGNFLQDPVSGDFIYSEQGNTFLNHMNAFASDGIQSVEKQIQYAQMAMGGVPQQSQSPAASSQPTTQQVAQQQRNAMRGRTNTRKTRQSNFNGVTAESGGDPTGAEQMSFGEATLAAMMTGTE